MTPVIPSLKTHSTFKPIVLGAQLAESGSA